MKKTAILTFTLFALISNLRSQSLIHSTISNGGTVASSTNFRGSTLGEYATNTNSITGATFYHGFQIIIDDGGSGSGYPICLNVTTSNPNGAGSLRNAIACAFDGDVITFDSGISGNYIYLDQPTIICNKNLTFLNNSNQLLKNQNASNTVDLIQIGKSVSFNGLGIEGTSENAMKIRILTQGELSINNADVMSTSIEN